MKPLSCLILAAGQGKRMKSDKPKVLHQLAGLPLVAYPLALARALKVRQKVLVVPKDYGAIEAAVNTLSRPGVSFAVQHPPQGTAHAVSCGLKKLEKVTGDILILNGDVPLVTQSDLEQLITQHRQAQAVLSFVSVCLDDPGQYGRVVRDARGIPLAIVEARDASEEQKKITEINAGLYLVDAVFLKEALKRIGTNNDQKEYYLTDLVKIAAAQGLSVQTLTLENAVEGLGVNTPEELAEAEELMYERKRLALKAAEVRLLNSQSVYIDTAVTVGVGTKIMGPCHLFGETEIGRHAVIEPGVLIRNSRVGDAVHLKAGCYIDESDIGHDTAVGPYAHLRPGTKLAAHVKVGNFVEVKKSQVGEGSKLPHLSYIGDAVIGRKVNVGAGTITCNYDGVNKFKTVLEDGVFIGSDTQLVAPVRVGKNAYVGAGSTITKNVSAGSLALTRPAQSEIKGWGSRKKNQPKVKV